MRYFDKNHEVYITKEQIEKENKTCVYQCTTEEFIELLENKRIWQGDKLILNPDYEKEQDRKEKEAQIKELQQELTSDDYKIIKCFEAQMTNKPLPYDLETLHNERQARRDRINELQELINT